MSAQPKKGNRWCCTCFCGSVYVHAIELLQHLSVWSGFTVSSKCTIQDITHTRSKCVSKVTYKQHHCRGASYYVLQFPGIDGFFLCLCVRGRSVMFKKSCENEIVSSSLSLQMEDGSLCMWEIYNEFFANTRNPNMSLLQFKDCCRTLPDIRQ